MRDPRDHKGGVISCLPPVKVTDHRNYEPLEVSRACYRFEASVALESLSAPKSDVHRTTQSGDTSWEEPQA
eukprot:gene30419-35424_t